MQSPLKMGYLLGYFQIRQVWYFCDSITVSEIYFGFFLVEQYEKIPIYCEIYDIFFLKNQCSNSYSLTHKQHNLLYITALNKHKLSQNLGQLLEFVQSKVNISNLFYCFIIFCSEKSNLNVGRLINIVLLDRDTNLSSIVSCCHTLCSSWQAPDPLGLFVRS